MKTPDSESTEERTDQAEPLYRGGSAKIVLSGEFITSPLWDKDGIYFLEIGVDETTKVKVDFKAASHCARPDVFQSNV